MEKKEKVELLKPKNDVVFHALFREDNKELLEKLISAILREEVKVETTDKNRFVEIDTAEEKMGVMDLRAELEGGVQCTIEIQLKRQEYENERFLYYWAKAYTRQETRGDAYEGLEKTISIVILDHEIEELKGIEKLGTKWQIRDEESGKRVLTDRLEIIIIELPKAKRLYKEDKDNEIVQWMIFLENPNESEVGQIVKENKTIKKALSELEQVSGDEKLRRIAELREKAIRDEKAALQYARKDGYKNGVEAGIEAGKNLGIEQGKNERNIEIAKNMLNKDINIEDIAEITGLSIEEIEKLAK